MAKPIFHATNSARKFGGKPEDYLHIHNKMDTTKSAHASMKHRIIFHSAFGIYLIEDLFGVSFENSDGRTVSTRDVAEQHVLEDLGFIPSLDDWLDEVNEKAWMAGIRKKKMVLVD